MKLYEPALLIGAALVLILVAILIARVGDEACPQQPKESDP